MSLQSQDPPATFARLIPDNANAEALFNDVCGYLHTQHSDELGKTMTYFHSRYVRASLEQDVQVPSDTDSEATVPDEAVVYGPWLWKGHYVFSHHVMPEFASLGWRLGYGRQSHNTESLGVDILLATKKQPELRAAHCRVYYKPEGHLVIETGRQGCSLTVDGKKVTANNPYTLVMSTHHNFQIGEFSYRFQPMKAASTQEERSNLNTFFRDVLKLPSPLESVSSSSTRPVQVGDWHIHQVVGLSGRTVISAATKLHGANTAGHKRMVRKGPHSRADAEIRRYRLLKATLCDKPHKDKIMTLVDVLYQSGTEDYINPDEVHIFWTPLARFDFALLIRQHWTGQQSLTQGQQAEVFLQVAQGLTALHSSGWVHRDIKPENLGVVNLQPVKICILDLEQAVYLVEHGGSVAASPGQGGTVGYLAPEQETSGGQYNSSVDNWSLGCVGLDLFFKLHTWKGRSINPWRTEIAFPNTRLCDEIIGEIRRIRRDLQNCPRASVESLLAGLLQEDPVSRYSAEQVCLHPAMRNHGSGASEIAIPSGRKRALGDTFN